MELQLALVATLAILQLNTCSGVPESGREPVSVRYKRSAAWDGFPSETIALDAFGRHFETPLNHVDRRHLDDVAVFVGTGGEFTEEYLEDEPADLYQNDNSVLLVNKRLNGGEWDVTIDGWFREGDDEIFVESGPRTDAGESGASHVASRDLRSDMENDFMYVLGTTDEFVRARRTGGGGDGLVFAVVDLLVLVDNAVYRKAFEQYGGHQPAIRAIKKYYRVLVSLVDMRYAEIEDPSFDIRVRLSKIYVAKDRSSSPWSEHYIRRAEDDPREMVLDPATGLKALREWLTSYGRHSVNVQYDHVMAFTGYTLMSPSGKITTGMAYVGTICQIDTGYSSSILSERGGFVNVGTAVHELAHSLGARHDGTSSNSVCPARENYIMAPFNTGDTTVLANYFSFSACSLRGFRATIGSEQAGCLDDSSAPGTLRGQLPGQAYSPDVQCRQVFGSDSGHCQSSGIQEPEEICVRLWCTKPTDPEICVTKAALSALYGTPCGESKICKQGFCVYDDTRRGHHETTNDLPANHNSIQKGQINPSGERCDRDGDPDYCYRLVTSGPQYCAKPDIRKFCCWSCYYTD